MSSRDIDVCINFLNDRERRKRAGIARAKTAYDFAREDAAFWANLPLVMLDIADMPEFRESPIGLKPRY